MVWSTHINLGGVYTVVCLMQLNTQEVHLGINSATSMMWNKLFNIYIYIHKVGNYTSKLNSYVLHIIDTLSSQGETTQGLLTLLF